jgi:folylpolyglutamate synthase/dihydropteroate synthase
MVTPFITRCEAESGDVVFVTGSFFVAGEVRNAWEQGSLSGCGALDSR